jgi:hypothetical protein
VPIFIDRGAPLPAPIFRSLNHQSTTFAIDWAKKLVSYFVNQKKDRQYRRWDDHSCGDHLRDVDGASEQSRSFARRVDEQIHPSVRRFSSGGYSITRTGKPASANALYSHCDKGPASRPMRSMASASRAMPATGAMSRMKLK